MLIHIDGKFTEESSIPVTDGGFLFGDTLFETLLAQGKPVGAHVLEAEWLDVGRHDELRRARGVL